jgi:hypothetical protein
LLVKVAVASQRLPDSIFIRLSGFEPTEKTFLGRGGYAHVHRATYGNRKVAVKILNASFDTSASVRLVSFAIRDGASLVDIAWFRSCAGRSWYGNI